MAEYKAVIVRRQKCRELVLYELLQEQDVCLVVPQGPFFIQRGWQQEQENSSIEYKYDDWVHCPTLKIPYPLSRGIKPQRFLKALVR